MYKTLKQIHGLLKKTGFRQQCLLSSLAISKSHLNVPIRSKIGQDIKREKKVEYTQTGKLYIIYLEY